MSFFFFSSRRRHTRFDCDWSSDVCSSDLYAGPIVVGRGNGGRRAIVGVKAGARLGRIQVRRGYASVNTLLPKKWVDKRRWARARKGVPIANGRNFGRVPSNPPRAGPPGDLDEDGLPGVLDVDH